MAKARDAVQRSKELEDAMSSLHAELAVATQRANAAEKEKVKQGEELGKSSWKRVADVDSQNTAL